MRAAGVAAIGTIAVLVFVTVGNFRAASVPGALYDCGALPVVCLLEAACAARRRHKAPC